LWLNGNMVLKNVKIVFIRYLGKVNDHGSGTQLMNYQGFLYNQVSYTHDGISVCQGFSMGILAFSRICWILQVLQVLLNEMVQGPCAHLRW
jgi:hypothetical protein